MKMVNFVLKLVLPVLPNGNTVNFLAHFYFTYAVTSVFLDSFHLMFLAAAIVFPQSIYSNIKSKYTDLDAIHNNNKKRFAIYL